MKDLIKDYVPIERIPLLDNLFTTIPPMGSLTVVVIDIETSSLSPETGRIYSIGIKMFGDWIHIDDIDEMTLLWKFAQFTSNLQNCVVVGHNVFRFDFPYILERATLYNIKMPFGYRTSYYGGKMERSVRCSCFLFPDNKFVEIEWYDKSVSIIDTYIIAGLVDSLYLFKSKSLKSLPIELGCRDHDRIELTPEEITDSWEKQDDRIEQYLKWDLDDNYDIFMKLFSPYYYMKTFLHGMSYQEIVLSSTAKKVESFMKDYYSQSGRREPDEKRPYKGGYTAARKGLFYNVIKADVASQYPFIMLAYRLGPGFDKDPCCYFFSLLKTMRDKRIEYKRSGDDEKIKISNAMKVIINSCYGLLGAEHHEYNNMDAAEAVTEYGRLIVKSMMDVINETGGTVVEVDTDGVMFTSPVPAIEVFDLMHTKMPPGMEIEHELTCDWMYVSGAKNYVYMSKGKLVKKGIFRKRNTIPLKTHFIFTFLEKWTTDGDTSAINFYNDLRSDIINYRLPVSMVTSKRRIGKAEVATLKYGKPGDEIHDYYGYNATGKKDKVISGIYNSHHYVKELDGWFKEIFSNITTFNELDEGALYG